MDDRDQHLSRISSLWTFIAQAHGQPGEGASTAQRLLLERYSVPVRRYLLGARRDPDAADEVFQEFAVRFLRGHFKNADPGRGRFRDYVRRALINLIIDYQKRRQRAHRPIHPAGEPAVSADRSTDADREFTERWREELLDRTWLALEEFERRTGRPSYTVLRLRTDHPQLPAEEMAARLGRRLGKGYTAEAFRKALQRAREKFTDLLLEEVCYSLEDPSPERLEEELTDLGLLAYCRAALQRRRRG